MISHTYIKKINLSLSEILSKKKDLEVTCVVPKKFFQNNKFIYPDYKKSDFRINLIQSNLINKSIRTQFFEKIYKILKKEKPDIIFIDNDTVCLQSFILIYWSFFFKYKLFYFCNENNLINIFKSFSIKKLLKLIVIFTMNSFIKFKIEKVFCYSKQIKKNYDFLGYKNKTQIIPLGFDKKVFFYKKKNISNFLKISYFGRIKAEKGIHILLESLKLIKSLNWNLTIDEDYIEDKNYFQEIKNQLKKNFSTNQYRFVKCNHYEIANFMRMSDIIVLPSIHEEQYGRVLQEAIACGNVAVGSKIGAITEIIKDKNLLFNPGDYLNLALIIEKLFNRKYYLSKFNKQYLDVMKNRTLDQQARLILKSL